MICKKAARQRNLRKRGCRCGLSGGEGEEKDRNEDGDVVRSL